MSREKSKQGIASLFFLLAMNQGRFVDIFIKAFRREATATRMPLESEAIGNQDLIQWIPIKHDKETAGGETSTKRKKGVAKIHLFSPLPFPPTELGGIEIPPSKGGS